MQYYTTIDRKAIIDGVTARIPVLSGGEVVYATVDALDSILDMYSWSMTNQPYPKTQIKGKTVRLHQLVAGIPPKGMVIDHKNRDRLDNTRDNLRFVTQGQNSKNQNISKRNTLGYKGISISGKKYKAEIKSDGITYRIGLFDTPIEAAKAYNQWAIKLHKEFASLNQI